MKTPSFLSAVAAVVALSLAPANAADGFAGVQLREGDIVFRNSLRGQSEAIMAATGSKYTHCGIVFEKDGKLMVLQAAQPVGAVSLDDFVAGGKPGSFTARRLKSPPDGAAAEKARSWAAAQLGKDYDHQFRWSDERIYCSELVWKIFHEAGVELCKPKQFKDYRLDDPAVRKLVAEKFGGAGGLPLEETVVAPSDIADSPVLAAVPGSE